MKEVNKGWIKSLTEEVAARLIGSTVNVQVKMPHLFSDTEFSSQNIVASRRVNSIDKVRSRGVQTDILNFE